MSWRLLGQEEYLSNKKFIKVNILEYKNKFKKKGRFHEHCEFCFEKIENIDLAFCTKNFYYWICPECFNDFKLRFNFEDFKQYDNFNIVYNPSFDEDTIIVENLKERYDASISSQLDVIIRNIYDNSQNGKLDCRK